MTTLTREQLLTRIRTEIVDNTAGEVSVADLRNILLDFLEAGTLRNILEVVQQVALTSLPVISSFDPQGSSDISPGNDLIINVDNAYYRIDIEQFAIWLAEGQVEDWAQEGNTDEIPADKLPAPVASLPATAISTTASAFSGHLSRTRDTNVQQALETLDALNVSMGGLTLADVDAQIVSWARVASTARIPVGRIPTSIARRTDVTNDISTHALVPDAHHAEVTTLPATAITVSAAGFNGNLTTATNTVQRVAQAVDDLTLSGGGLTATAVRDQIATWARTSSPSGTIPDARIPATIARDAEITSAINAHTGVADAHHAAGLTQSQVDARIATWARAVGASGTIPDASIPATIARDTEVSSSIAAHTANANAHHVPVTTLNGSAVSIVSAGFNGNLATTDNTAQKVAQALDDLDISTLGLNQLQVDARITFLRPVDFTAADQTKLDELGGEDTILFSGTVTAVTNVNDIEADQRSGQTARGTITGDTQLQRIHLDGDSGALTIILSGRDSAYAGDTFSLGNRHIKLSQATLNSYNSGTDTTQYDFFGNYSDWLPTTSIAWQIREPTIYIDAGHLHDVTQLLNTGLASGDAFLFDDASISAGSQLRAIRVSQLDRRWGAAPLVNSFPIPLIVGERYKLISEDTIIWPTSYGATVFQTDARIIAVNKAGFNGVYAYDASHGTPSLAGKVFVNMDSGAGYTTLWLYQGTNPVPYSISPTGVPGNPRFHEVEGLVPGDVTSGQSYNIESSKDDGTFLERSRVYEPGDWTVTGAFALTHTPNSASLWAEFGNTQTIPQAKFPVFDLSKIPQLTNAQLPDRIDESKITVPTLLTITDREAGPGTTVNNSSADARIAPVGPTTTFDMDDAGKDAGVLDVEIELTLSNRLNNTIAWEQAANQDEAADNLTTRFSETFTITSLQATPVYQPSGAIGLLVGQRTVYQGASTLGDVLIYATRDSDNQLGIWLFYDGNSGSQRFTVSSTMTITFLHSDTGTELPIPTAASQYFGSGAGATAPFAAGYHPLPSAITQYARLVDLPALVGADNDGTLAVVYDDGVGNNNNGLYRFRGIAGTPSSTVSTVDITMRPGDRSSERGFRRSTNTGSISPDIANIDSITFDSGSTPFTDLVFDSQPSGYTDTIVISSEGQNPITLTWNGGNRWRLLRSANLFSSAEVLITLTATAAIFQIAEVPAVNRWVKLT